MKHFLNISSANCHLLSAICHKPSAISHPQPKIYKTLLTFNFLLLTLLSSAQFNIILEDTARNHIYISLIDSDTSIIVQSGSGDSLGNRGLYFSKHDTLGNLIWEKSYTKNNEDWYEGYKYGLIKDGNKYISCLIILKNYTEPHLMVLDESFDTLYTTGFDVDTLNIALYSIAKSYNGYILSGQRVLPDGTVKGYILKINNNLDTIWSNIYSNGESILLGNKIIETYDSSIITIGHTYTGTAVYKQDWYIVKTDSLGNLDWWLHPGNSQLNDGAAQDIIQTRDSCFIVVGGKAVYNDGASNPKFDGRIMKIDINGNVLWDKTYRRHLYVNLDSLYCFFSSIVELDDGGFAVLATEQQDLGGVNYHSVLYRLNADGDSLYTKQYCARCTYANDGQNITGSEYSTTIQKTDNGGFLIGGWGNFVYTFDHAYEQQMFIIKTDSLGCDGTEFSCPTVYLPYVADKQEQSLLVYPNPSKNTVFLEIKNDELKIKNDNTIFVYDVFGRCVIVQPLHVIANSQSEAISINIEDLEKGVYFVKVGQNVAKFVKE